MPKSKRAKVVSLTKVSKQTREQKGSFISEVQENADKWKYCWLFEVGNMRNTHLKTVRKLWKDTARIFFGRCGMMAKALGSTPEEEHKPGLHQIATQLKGQVGLMFTDTEPDEVKAWFADFRQPDFARSGNVATRDIVLPAGPIMQHHADPPEPFPHNEEPQLRKLGLSTSLVRGVPTLTAPHTLCKKGKPLTSEQAQLLKLIGERMVEFKVVLRAKWVAATGEVTMEEGETLAPEEKMAGSEETPAEDDVDEMSECDSCVI
ncbi:hypothetical protein BD410DRAFT_788825 [Rickenella mellea]|uniref:Ribosome assembly factor mrt4 n=1 Tax=Rickenella mellea TaxID=50990 RepID=A0A4Y7Q4M9_9AGAM|nr:hypothetical protein BD410DRAFT_788825 [Rickenella mellea]